jgi:hypothetical protein
MNYERKRGHMSSTNRKILDRITTPWNVIELTETPKGLQLELDGIALSDTEVEDLRRIIANLPGE